MSNKLKVASFNIQSLRRHPDLENVDQSFSAAVLKKHMPQIVGLNEVSSDFGETLYGVQPEGLAKETEYNYHFHAPIVEFPGRLYGNGLMSKHPIKHAEMIPIPDPEVQDEDTYYETRCILKAEIDVCGGITVLVTHFGLAKSEQRNAVETVLKTLGENPKKTILMGDLNITSDNEFLKPIKEILNDTAEGYDENKLLSWPSINPELKIDYIFVSEDIKVESTYVADEVGSDHKMIIAELVLND